MKIDIFNHLFPKRFFDECISRGSAGKDMGIWQVSMVLPQIVGPAATGWMLSWIKSFAGARPAYVAAFITYRVALAFGA